MSLSIVPPVFAYRALTVMQCRSKGLVSRPSDWTPTGYSSCVTATASGSWARGPHAMPRMAATVV